MCILIWTIVVVSTIVSYLVYGYVQAVLIDKITRRSNNKLTLMLYAPLMTAAIVFYTLYGLWVAIKAEITKRRNRKK